jgi:hypothetical protein
LQQTNSASIAVLPREAPSFASLLRFDVSAQGGTVVANSFDLNA